jgi:response regulator RpfG family c-di-GMP phosphodiesterase
MTPTRPRLLIVDDEQLVLDALARTLRSGYDVRTALSGAAGLAALAEDPTIALVMSDMRMPVMNGSAFLSKVRGVAPSTVRILLTGQADLDDAMAAINEGSIFRFLRKPCPPETLAAALAAATEQHRLVHAEKELLEQTLRGSVQALSDTLALANPGVFGIATRVKRLAARIAELLGVKNAWQLEIAAMVCQLGAVSSPGAVFDRRARAEALTPVEQEMLDKVPDLSERLIAHIPRLEAVREIVRYSRVDFDASGPLPLTGARIPTSACILRVALDFEERLAAGDSRQAALTRLRATAHCYDRHALDALATICADGDDPAVDLPVSALRRGMIVACDIRTKGGVLLVARGHEVTVGLLSRLENFGAELASKTVRVDVPRAVSLRTA